MFKVKENSCRIPSTLEIIGSLLLTGAERNVPNINIWFSFFLAFI